MELLEGELRVRQNSYLLNNPLNGRQRLSDPELEIVDPTPDIKEMFLDFDLRFFNGWLNRQAVVVEWSSNMTTCAGLCRWEPRSQFCQIRLSSPLLKLRSRCDLVETLLHEMIHAFLFVKRIDDNHESHGNIFHEHMYRINHSAGLNISVYHTFHDEVRFYKTHVWRCDGPCRNQRPFFGYVRRATNRKPAPHDFWFAKHQKECGGQFIKISEPEKTNKKTSARKSSKSKATKSSPPKAGASATANKDIRDMLKSPPARGTMITSSGRYSTTRTIYTINDGSVSDSTIDLNQLSTIPVSSNIYGFGSSSADQANKREKHNFTPFVGKGHSLIYTPRSSSTGINRAPLSRLVQQFGNSNFDKLPASTSCTLNAATARSSDNNKLPITLEDSLIGINFDDDFDDEKPAKLEDSLVGINFDDDFDDDNLNNEKSIKSNCFAASDANRTITLEESLKDIDFDDGFSNDADDMLIIEKASSSTSSMATYAAAASALTAANRKRPSLLAYDKPAKKISRLSSSPSDSLEIICLD